MLYDIILYYMLLYYIILYYIILLYIIISIRAFLGEQIHTQKLIAIEELVFRKERAWTLNL